MHLIQKSIKILCIHIYHEEDLPLQSGPISVNYLLAGQDPEIVIEAFADLQEYLAHAGLMIASEKVQQPLFHINTWGISYCRQE